MRNAAFQHDYKPDCQCYRCKGIRGAGYRPPIMKRSSVKRGAVASRSEQQARYLDCGPQNWDGHEGGF